MWKVVTSSNLNSLLKLFFYSPILTNNNLFLKIYYENIVVTFLKYDFLFFILFLLSLFSFHPYVFFFSTLSPPHTLSYLCPHPPSFSFSPSFKSQERSSTHILYFFFSSSLSLFFFLTWFQNSRPQRSPNGSSSS